MTDPAAGTGEVAIPEEGNILKARTSKRVAWLLDECIRIPGTKIKFGLDPLVGMIPMGGPALATIVGATVLGEAGKKGIPFKTLVRMAGNLVLNAVVGTFPFLGDLFSFWFKSNKRNYEMLNEFLESEEGKEAKGGWWPLIFIFMILGVVILTNITVWFLIIFCANWLLKESGLQFGAPK